MKKLGFGLMRLPLLDPEDERSIDVETVKKMADAFLSPPVLLILTQQPAIMTGRAKLPSGKPWQNGIPGTPIQSQTS